MPIYNYTARDKNGTEIAGTIDAVNEQSARVSLQAIELEPMYLQARKEEAPEDSSEQIIDTPEVEAPSPMVKAQTWQQLEEVQPVAFTKEQSPALHENWTTFNEDEAYERKDESQMLPADSPHLEKDDPEAVYYPLGETVRLYAGWLLAWYGLVYILGHYERSRQPLPSIPYVSGLLYSPAIFTFTLGCFLYLFCHTLMRRFPVNTGVDFLISLVGIGIFVSFLVSI